MLNTKCSIKNMMQSKEYSHIHQLFDRVILFNKPCSHVCCPALAVSLLSASGPALTQEIWLRPSGAAADCQSQSKCEPLKSVMALKIEGNSLMPAGQIVLTFVLCWCICFHMPYVSGGGEKGVRWQIVLHCQPRFTSVKNRCTSMRRILALTGCHNGNVKFVRAWH